MKFSVTSFIVRRTTSNSGRFIEWHLVFLKSIEDITFDFVPGLHHAIVFLLPEFSHARFKAIGAVGDAMVAGASSSCSYMLRRNAASRSPCKAIIG